MENEQFSHKKCVLSWWSKTIIDTDEHDLSMSAYFPLQSCVWWSLVCWRLGCPLCLSQHTVWWCNRCLDAGPGWWQWTVFLERWTLWVHLFHLRISEKESTAFTSSSEHTATEHNTTPQKHFKTIRHTCFTMCDLIVAYSDCRGIPGDRDASGSGGRHSQVSGSIRDYRKKQESHPYTSQMNKTKSLIFLTSHQLLVFQ